jgi:glutathione S-transferase
MKLYYSKGSCSLAVRIIINEMNLSCEYEAVNLKTKQTETGMNFLSINPKGAVPVLQLDNNDILTENAAIQQYLADVHRADKLLPPLGNLDRYHVLEWLNYIATDIHKGCAPFFNPNLPAEIKTSIFLPLIKNKLAFLEQHLAENDYLTGENFTLPDGYLFVILTWLPGLKIDINEFPAVTNYFNRLKTRESIVKSLKEEAGE